MEKRTVNSVVKLKGTLNDRQGRVRETGQRRGHYLEV